MANNILLIAHAQSYADAGLLNDLDSDLTEFGQREARRLIAHLKDMPYNFSNFVGWTSPHLRCLQVASETWLRLGVDFRVSRLARGDYDADRCFVDYRAEDFPEFDWVGYPQHGMTFERESDEDYRLRVADFLGLIRSGTKDAMIVTHPEIIETFVQIISGRHHRLPSLNSYTWIVGDEVKIYGETPAA